MKCKRCTPGNAFHWRDPEYRSGVDWRGFAVAAKSSKSASDVIDKKRAAGRNPSTVLMQNKTGYVPNFIPNERLVTQPHKPKE